ncbi:MAG: LytTR family DNA-binding domain-containing protein [Bacteroidota bacterium]
MIIKAIAIDDEAPALAVISKHASKLPFLSLEQTFTNPLKAISWLQAHKVDLIFLDIEMPEMRGTDFMRMMSGLSTTSFIFTTAYESYALEGFELQAVDYLLKPILFPRFASACKRVLAQTAPPKPASDASFLFVKDGHNWVRIDFQDILFARSDGNLLFIHQTNHRVVTRMTLQSFLNTVPKAAFVRTHKSYAVALSAVHKIERSQLVLSDGTAVPLARSYRSSVTQNLIQGEDL